MSTRFYGVAGVNAYGVYNDYVKVVESRTYVKNLKTKGSTVLKKQNAGQLIHMKRCSR